jgi:hypothetical protein
MLLSNSRGGYSFLRGIGPYSAGVIAEAGFTIEHVRLPAGVPWKAGLESAEAHLRLAGRPREALCAVALRSPKPFSFDGFNQFNAVYVEFLKSWDLLVDGLNPIARTNVAPELDPPDEPLLYSFAYTKPSASRAVSLVVAGAGELPEGSLDPEHVIRRGETSPEALAAKARFVLDLMERRVHGLGASWSDVTVTNIYTVHDLNALLASRFCPAGRRRTARRYLALCAPADRLHRVRDGPARRQWRAQSTQADSLIRRLISTARRAA